MASIVWPILLGFVTFISFIIGLIIYIKYNNAIKKIDVEPNMPIIWATCRRQFTNGYCIGLVKTIRKNYNKTFLIEMYPLDSRQGPLKPIPQMQSFVVAEEFLEFYSIGSESSFREIIRILPRTKYDLPDKMRPSEEADYLSQKSQMKYVLSVVSEGISNGDDAIANLMRQYHRGQISQDFLLDSIQASKTRNLISQGADATKEKEERK